MRNESSQGWLEGWAAKAAALTTILTLVFLLLPQLRPGEGHERETRPAETVGSAGVSPSPARVSDPGEVQAIRAVLEWDHAAGVAVQKTADAPSMRSPDAADPSAYFQGVRAAALPFANALDTYLVGMGHLSLANAPPAFQTAYLAHIVAWQERANLVDQFIAVADMALAESSGPAPNASNLQRYNERLHELDQLYRSDTGVNRTWSDVRRASLAVGVDTSEYESH